MTDAHSAGGHPQLLTAADIITILGLEPHPEEGGFFTRTYYADEYMPQSLLPKRYRESHRIGSAIYYLITPDSYSSLHRLTTDEIFHFYLGDPVEMLQLRPDGSGEIVMIGTDFAQGMRPQVIVPRGVWQGTRLTMEQQFGFALLGTTMAPGFEYSDYTHGNRVELAAAYPNFREKIFELSR